jgi:hypothetical protein
LSMREIANATGLSVPAVKSRLLRARILLRKTLDPQSIERTSPSRSRAFLDESGISFGCLATQRSRPSLDGDREG